jgi:hypothetical protein
MNKNPWKRGAKFRIRYRIPGQRYDREMVATYLGMPSHRDVRVRPGRRIRQFSGRPEYGTTELELDWVLGNEEVPADTKCYAGRRAPVEP